jgi:hypothetical protein
MSAGRVVLLVIGSLIGLIGLGLAAGGGTLIWAHETQRDEDGFFTTSTERFRTTTFALTSDEVDLGAGAGEADWSDLGDLARVRVRATGDAGRPLFVGIGPERDVEAYLAGVAHDEVSDVDFDPFRVEYRRQAGAAAPAPPGRQPFWVARSAGPGTRTLEWDLEGGTWALVVMNADASRGVAADVDLGIEVDLLLPVAIGILAGGLLLLAGGVTMVALGARSPRAPPAPAPGAPAAAGPHGPGPAPLAADGARPYPLRLGGALEEEPSRWLWLVKWLLAIPHFIILVFLWIAFVVLTAVAFVAILVTGRYPRGIFDFNVGVMRWTWRVSFYSYSALATDRYPPFSLGPADHPATLEVDHPERLSRGLVLVKWWLLAIPHYVILGIFGTGLWWSGGWVGRGGWEMWAWGSWGGGLLGVLVLFAAAALLFTGRYRRDLFRLVMGINRWTFRVLAYAALMRDEYPPFRLDAEEPGTVAGTPGGGSGPPRSPRDPGGR